MAPLTSPPYWRASDSAMGIWVVRYFRKMSLADARSGRSILIFTSRRPGRRMAGSMRSNRQDLIDPAILRPGRLDVKIKIERPDRSSANDIFLKYLTTQIPIAESEARQYGGDVKGAIDGVIAAAVEAMYSLSEENRFLEVTYANGDKEVLYFKDFSSGAMIESVVRRAKK